MPAEGPRVERARPGGSARAEGAERGSPAVLPERARGAREAKSRVRIKEVTERAMALAYGGRGREGTSEEE